MSDDNHMILSAAELIEMSIRENRTVAEYPNTREEAETLLLALGAECADDCPPREHHSGAGYSGSDAAGYYPMWGTTEDGDDWIVHVMCADLDDDSMEWRVHVEVRA